MQLYLDCDGVLADFDAGAQKILGAPAKAYQDKHGLSRFWGALGKAPDFYATLPLMPDARELFGAVAHLHPIILTGVPRGGWAEAQKAAWVKRHFPGTKVITTFASKKCSYCRSGDVLVDDTLKYKHLWENAGGVFIHHRSAKESIAALTEYIDL
jgi:hypothetical protein